MYNVNRKMICFQGNNLLNGRLLDAESVEFELVTSGPAEEVDGRVFCLGPGLLVSFLVDAWSILLSNQSLMPFPVLVGGNNFV